MVVFAVLGVIAGVIWLIYQYCVTQTSNGIEAVIYALVLCLVPAAFFVVPYLFISMVETSNSPWVWIVIFIIVSGYVVYQSFRSEYLARKRRSPEVRDVLIAQLDSEKPTKGEIDRLRREAFEVHGEYLSDERLEKIWRQNRWAEIWNARVDEDRDILFGWKHKFSKKL